MRLTYKVKVDMPNLPHNTEVDVNDVGMLVNGHTKELELDSSVAEVLRDTPGFEVTKVTKSEKAQAKAEAPQGEAKSSEPEKVVLDKAPEPMQEGGEQT